MILVTTNCEDKLLRVKESVELCLVVIPKIIPLIGIININYL